MTERIKLVQGDTGPEVKATLTDQNTNQPVSLLGATVYLRLRAQGGTEILATSTGFLNPGTAKLGQVIFPWQEGDLELPPGLYEGEIEVVFPTGVHQTVYEPLQFVVREDFD